jgi:hypothetical protein
MVVFIVISDNWLAGGTGTSWCDTGVSGESVAVAGGVACGWCLGRKQMVHAGNVML